VGIVCLVCFVGISVVSYHLPFRASSIAYCHNLWTTCLCAIPNENAGVVPPSADYSIGRGTACLPYYLIDYHQNRGAVFPSSQVAGKIVSRRARLEGGCFESGCWVP